MSTSPIQISVIVNNSTYYEDFDLRINVRKPIGEFGYSVSPPEDSICVSYIGSPPVEADEVVEIIDRSESLRANSKYLFVSKGEEVFVSSSAYSTTASEIEGTDVFLPISDPSYIAQPAWYYHVLPENAIAAKLNRGRSESGLFPVDTLSYIVSLSSRKLFTALQNTYDPDTGAFEVFFVDSTLSDGTVKRQLLQGHHVLHEATLDDLDLSTGDIDANSGGYSLSQNGDTFTYTFSDARTKIIKEKRRSRIYPYIPDNILLDDPWSLFITNGKFTNRYNGFLYEYILNEHSSQVFTPYYPYMLRNSETVDVLGNHLIKVSRNVVFDISKGLHIDVVVRNNEGTVKSAISSRSNAILRKDYEWSISTNFSVDTELGLVFNFDVDAGVGDIVEITYFYESQDYEFTDIEFNPYRNPGVEEYMWVIYLVPNVASGYNSLYYLKVDKDNVIVDASQGIGEHLSGFPADFLNFTQTTEDGFINPLTAVGMFYRNYGTAESGDTFWVDLYSTEGSNVYQYQILAEIVFRNNQSENDFVNIDTRVFGGGIRPSRLSESLVEEPALQHILPELCNPFTGIPYPGHFSSVVRVPYTLLTEYGGSMTMKEIEDKLYIHAPSGSYFIIELGGVIPRICSVEPGTSRGTINLSWVIEAPEYQYNVYVSKSWKGPWKANNSGTKHNSSPIVLSSYNVGDCSDTYTIAGLVPGQVYKVAVTAVDSVTGIESPPSIIYEVTSGAVNRNIPDQWQPAPPVITLTYSELINTTGTEGEEYIVDEGGTYTWSGDANYWIRKDAYDLLTSSITLEAKIDGHTVPQSESPTWTNALISATITTDGEYVTWNSIGGGNLGMALSVFNFSNKQPQLVQGFIQVVNVEGTDSLARNVLYVLHTNADSGRLIRINLYHDANSGEVRFIDSSNTAIGTVVDNVEINTTDKFIEFLVNPSGDCKIWFDNVADASLVAAYADFPVNPNPTTEVGIGDGIIGGGTQNSHIRAKGIKVYSIT